MTPPTKFLGTPYLQDPDLTIWNGDVREVLRSLPDESVQMCVTSPPYWGLRDYGTEGQIGLEPTPEAFVATMVEVFREVRRVLRKDGTLWLNLGDSYAANGKGDQVQQTISPGDKYPKGAGHRTRADRPRGGLEGGLATVDISRGPGRAPGLKAKDLCMIPARVALALQADGWYLRSEITWCKPNPMPESVTDRPTQATEKIYLFSRSPRYFYDAEAIREANQGDGRKRGRSKAWDEGVMYPNRNGHTGLPPISDPALGRNLRNWWEISTEPMAEKIRSVRRVREEPGAGVDGKRRITSPDCPVHGDRPAPVATLPDGEREGVESTRTERIAARLDREPLTVFAPTEQNPERVIELDSLGSPVPGDAPTASARSRGSRKTASRSASGGKPSEGTPARTGGTSPSSESPGSGGFDSPGSSGTPDHTSRTCTCEWEYTEYTSHFAAFPSELVRRCILAGSSERGCCPECGAPWVREVERETVRDQSAILAGGKNAKIMESGQRNHALSVSHSQPSTPKVTTLGWRPSCGCVLSSDGYGIGTPWPLQVIPCTILDPFFGSGTTGLVARKHGRKTIGIELSPEYCALAARRLSQLSLLAEGAA